MQEIDISKEEQGRSQLGSSLLFLYQKETTVCSVGFF